MKENYEIQNNVPEKSSLICDDDDIVCRWVGCILCPSTAIQKGNLESEVELATNREKKQRLKTFWCIIIKYWMVDKNVFFMNPFAKSCGWGSRNLD